MNRRSTMFRRWHLYLVPAIAFLLFTAFRWQDESEYLFRVNKGLEVFGQVYREVAQSYVDQVDPETFLNAGIEGMLKTLDPYTVYMDREEAADIDMLTAGSYAGIGMTVGLRDSMVTVVDVVDGHSAQRSGLRIGDRISSINGVQVLRGPVDMLRTYTRGEPGTTLEMSVLREGIADPLHLTLTRENIKVRSVGYAGMIEPGIGYIQLSRFASGAGMEVRNAILDLTAKGGLDGLVLDLRNNPGGLLESAVDVASKFVPNGSVIVSTRGRDSREDRVYRSTEDPIAEGIPLVVLINGNSASASEIVAGAIQDLDVGVVMGERSFGKGLVQSMRRLPYDASLKITTARYYTPSGRSIQKIDYASLRQGDARTVANDGTDEFLTAHGRRVTGHGGVLPDSSVVEELLPSALAWLREDLVLFRFATRYAATHRIDTARFELPANVLAEFEEYAIRSIDSLQVGPTTIERARELATAARDEGSDAETLGDVEQLYRSLLGAQRRILHRSEGAIRAALEEEILARVQTQRARLLRALAADRQLRSAASVLRSVDRDYGRLLSAR